jgi:hypothetical protein
MHRQKSSSLLLLFLFPPIAFAASPIQERADRFLKLANAGYQALYRVKSKAQWLSVAEGPMTNPNLVAKRAAAEQSSSYFI